MAVLLLLLMNGCADADLAGRCIDTPCPGGDGGVANDAGMEPGPDDDAGPLDLGFSERGAADPDFTCSDGLDNDNVGGVDCEDTLSCGASAYCCVGSTESACCDAVQDVTTEFGACAGPGLAACSGVTSVFGSPLAQLEEGRFVPNGDGQDSGIVLGAVVDGRTDRLRIQATVETPLETCDCADAVAFGVGSPPTPQNPRPDLDVAVMARRAYGDIALVVEDEVVWSQRYTSGEFELTLVLNPDGSVRLHLPDTLDGEPTEDPVARWNPRPGRNVLLYGRTPNRSEIPVHTSIVTASLTSSRCEVPTALGREPAPLSVSGAQPTVARHEGVLWMATAGDGQIAFHQEGPTGWTAETGSTLTQAGFLSNPELIVENGSLVLYAEVESDGKASIVRYERAETGAWGEPEPVTLPGENWGQPTVLHTASEDWLAALNYDDATITLFRWDDLEEVYVSAYTLGSGADQSHFHADEVADPELAQDGANLLRLYYAGRRGTRWAIGMQLSENGTVWRDPGTPGEAVLSASGQGHDALGVRSPSVLMEEGQVRLYHTASDGLVSRVGLADGTTW